MYRMLTVSVILAFVTVPAHAQKKSKDRVDPIAADQEVGRTFRISPDQLPQPKATRAVSNRPLTLPFEAQVPKVPDGFQASLFAKLEHPRRMLVLPNGDIIVAEQNAGHLTLLRAGANGKAEFIERHAENFNRPYGLAWRNGHILVADQDGIWSVPHKLGDVRTGHGDNKKVADVPPEQRKPSPHFNAHPR